MTLKFKNLGQRSNTFKIELDLKQPLNDTSLYPEHIAFYFTEISLLGQELLAFKDWLSVPFWAIFRIFVTQFLKNGKSDREKISYFSKSV